MSSKFPLKALSIGEKSYPDRLRAIADPPEKLYYRGNIALLKSEACISIVGSRNADGLGLELAGDMARNLAAVGATIVSGLALGIDGAAHRGALDIRRKGTTIAVLGCGLNRMYPPSHAALAKQILESGGLILSQFEPEERPYPSNFLNRNRVIAGLSLGTVVVQAAARSGALATARYALESGRDIFSVPGSVRDPRHKGTNRLIQQGAYLVSGADEILEMLPELGTIEADSKAEEFALSESQASLIELLAKEERIHYDDLAQSQDIGGSFAVDVLELELAGAIQRLPGNFLSLR